MPISMTLPEYKLDKFYGKTQEKLFGAGEQFLAGDIGIADPTYATSPYYKSGIKELSGVGEGLLRGEVPEFYKGIGQPGGGDFEGMMGMAKRDVSRAVNEDLVRRGISRGGIGTSAIAKTTADLSKSLRYQNLLDSISGKKALLQAGLQTTQATAGLGLQESQYANMFGMDLAKYKLGIKETGLAALGDVRSGALSQTGLEGQFDLSKAELEFKIAQFNEKERMANASNKAGLWEAGLGMVGTVAGAGIGAGLFSKGGNTLNKDVYKKSIAAPGTVG